MPRACACCEHPKRVGIDRCLVSGVSLRDISKEFGVHRSSIGRHQDHVVQAVKRTIERRTVEREEAIASKWKERLETSYESAERGVVTAAGDPKQWPAGARFLAVMAKLIETGLQVDGVIGPTAVGSTVTTTEHVLVLPNIGSSATIESNCELLGSPADLHSDLYINSQAIDSKDNQ